MSTVVALELHRKLNKQRAGRKHSLFPTTSPAFNRAWAIFPESGRRRSSTIESWPAWQDVAKQLGEEKLEQAVKAYAAHEDSRKECGAPGFHRWLKMGRWEHYLSKQEPPKPTEHRFPDEALRESFFAKVKDERARRWFDRCTLEGKILVHPGWALRAEWVERFLWPWLEANGLEGYRKQ